MQNKDQDNNKCNNIKERVKSMKMKWLKMFGLFTGLLLLASCGDVNGGAKEAGNGKELVDVSAIEKKYPAYFKNDAEAVQVDTLKVAIVSDSPFKGIFNGFLYSDAIDNNFMKYTMNGAFPIDDDLKLILDSDETPIKVTINPEEKTVTYKINPNFKQSNRDPVTTKDIVKKIGRAHV